MAIDTNQFWNLLSESRLIDLSKIQALFAEFVALHPQADVNTLSQWLISSQALTPYQAKILAAGVSGPMHYGNYEIVGRIDQGPMAGAFQGRHRPTGYAVLLQFVPGSQQTDLQIWKRLSEISELISQNPHPDLVPVYESIAIPDYRFVVSRMPDGTSLDARLPRKSRLPWPDACKVIASVARALSHLHRHGITHHAVSPRTIWVSSARPTQLRLSFLQDQEFEDHSPDQKGGESKFDYLAPETLVDATSSSQLSDVYSLGCTLYRIIAGRPPFPETELHKKIHQHRCEHPASLDKYQLPGELSELIRSLMAKPAAQRPADMATVADQLATIAGLSADGDLALAPPTETEAAFFSSIRHWTPGSQSNAVLQAPTIQIDSPEVSPELGAPQLTGEAPLSNSPADTNGANARFKPGRKKKPGKWMLPVSIAASLLLTSGIIGSLAYFASRQTVNVTPDVVGPNGDRSLETNTNPSGQPTPDDNGSDLDPVTPSNQSYLTQNLIADDGQSLWQTPTDGPPIDFGYLPSAPKILAVARPREIFGQTEGTLLLKSAGPAFAQTLRKWSRAIGLQPNEIAHLVLSLHSNEQFQYEPFFVVQPDPTIGRQQLLERWNQPTAEPLDTGNQIYKSPDGHCYYFFGSGDNGEAPLRVAVGSAGRVQEVASLGNAESLTGSLRRMASWTDNRRHLTIMFLRNALFNDEGKKLMGAPLAGINRELDLLLNDGIRGGIFSAHWDDGCYLELRLDRNLDLKANDLRDSLEDSLRTARDKITGAVGTLPAHPHWDRIRLRYVIMLADFYRQIRVDVEHGEVVANAWLAPMATHNLLAASELAVFFAPNASAPSNVATSNAPVSLADLLERKRDLNVTTNPDLNLLLSDLQTEIIEDLGPLRFPFEIRLMGPDLAKDGITQNQRPGDFSINQATISDILTQIAVRANPDQNITGPADPNCKLIWVVADDPSNPGSQVILFTTRSAAAEKSYELPAAFRPE